jgi:phosphoribosylformimino-5-aminoimidazole carboxamide ribotide isomerase
MRRRGTGEVAMLIPSIDLMGGKIVQLVQGERKALEFDDFDPWVRRFEKFPIVQLIDLDAALGTGSNRALVAEFARRLPCQVGGGIRSVAIAQEVLAAGARRVIIGSSLIKDGAIDVAFVQQLAPQIGRGRLIFAVDSRGGKVAIAGWREITTLDAPQMMRALDPFCSGFLYTHVDTEGLMQGFPRELVPALRTATTGSLAVAGGIATMDEVHALEQLGADAVVGMAIYTGALAIE